MHVRRLAFVCFVAMCVPTASCSCGGENNGNNTNNGTNNNTNNSNNMNNVNNLPDAEFGLDERPGNSTCVAPPRQPFGASVDFEEVLVGISLIRNSVLLEGPNGKWFIGDKVGEIREADSPDSDEVRTWLSIRSLTNSGLVEGGLRGIAFHPDFERNGFIYVSYMATQGGETSNVVSRFTANSGGGASAATQYDIITIPQPEGHFNNGGSIAFGADRMLYLAVGEGGVDTANPGNDAQDPNTLLGTIIRLDIDGGDPYAIPPDNPFANGGGAPEVWAYGFQNPKIAFDKQSGELWVADNGVATAEEVSFVKKGGNYGFPDKEGRACLNLPLCQEGQWIDPVIDYAHSSGNTSILGGVVYNGSITNLKGIYVYADAATGKIFGLFYDQWGKPAPTELLDPGFPISAIGSSDDGEVYFAQFDGGIYRMIDNGTQVGALPPTLSATGCVDPDDPTQPSAGMIAYGPNAPFYSDDAEKLRYFAIPDGTTIEVTTTDDWVLPPGSVTMKHFKIADRFIETRFFVRHEDESYSGYTYEWNDDQSDATLVRGGKIKDVGAQFWSYPTQAQCMECHTEAAGGTLGLETRQQNAPFNYFSTNRRANQLNTLDHIGVVTKPDDPKDAMPDPFGEGSLDDRARAYLHTNCASCHRSANELGRVDFDVTYDGFLEELCDEPNTAGDFGLPGAGRLVPGDSAASTLYHRTTLRDAYGMPNLGSFSADDPGAALVAEWIDSLGGCP